MDTSGGTSVRNASSCIGLGIAGYTVRKISTVMEYALLDTLPSTRRVHQWQSNASQSTRARGSDKRAVDALREGTIDASILTRLAGRTGAKRRELRVEGLRIKAVLQSERSALPECGGSSGEDSERDGDKEGS